MIIYGIIHTNDYPLEVQNQRMPQAFLPIGFPHFLIMEKNAVGIDYR
jgi:hypothetical protein